MGTDKALVPLGGVSLIGRVLAVLDPIFDEVLVSTARPGQRRGLARRTVEDLLPGGGALVGVYSTLSVATYPWLFAVGCDMPLVRAALVERLWSLRRGADAVVPETGRGLEPLCAFYSRRCLGAMARGLAAGERGFAHFLGEVRLRRVGPEVWGEVDPRGESFLNANTPRDLEALRRRVARRAVSLRRPGTPT